LTVYYKCFQNFTVVNTSKQADMVKYKSN
jgi:hypothetical protein